MWRNYVLLSAPRRFYAPSFLLLMATSALSLLLVAPNHAQSGPPGSYSGPVTTGGTASKSGSTSASYFTSPQTGYYGDNVNGTGLSCTGQIETKWTWNASTANAPVPQWVIVKQFCNATWESTTAAGKCDDGLTNPTDPPVTTSSNGDTHSTSSGTHYSLVQADSKGNVTVDCTPTASVSSGSCGVYYSVSFSPLVAGIVVDQDQRVLAPAATTRFSATISASGFTIDSVKISVDGTPTAATVNPSNPNNYYIDWPQTGGNPSEHAVTATAQIHSGAGATSLNSTDPPNRQYATSGMGRPADDIIADVQLQSIKFNNNIALSQDAATAVPSPEITWTQGGVNPSANPPATANPAAYVQGKNVNLTLLLGSSAGAALTGNATMGYLCKLQASPNTINPATSAADPVLTLYDNTTASPTVPAPCSASTTVAATTALNSWVSSYTTSLPVLTFYVEFTKIPTPTWGVLSSYNSAVGNTVYAVVATPTAPMATPWVGVLNYACNWAKRTTSATSATTALTTGLYNAGHYNGGSQAFTGSFVDGSEDFHLKSYLASSTPYSLYGQCNDFADFLVCLSNAVGARPLKTQRSVTVAEDSAGSHFFTKPVTAAPDQTKSDASPVSSGWAYHQWANDTSIFDGSIRFSGTTTPSDMTGPAFGSTYNTSLVASYLHMFSPPALPVADWDPQSPFVPNIVN